MVSLTFYNGANEIGAKKAGLHTCLAKYGCIDYKEEMDVADYAIEKIEEVRVIIDKIGS